MAPHLPVWGRVYLSGLAVFCLFLAAKMVFAPEAALTGLVKPGTVLKTGQQDTEGQVLLAMTVWAGFEGQSFRSPSAKILIIRSTHQKHPRQLSSQIWTLPRLGEGG